MYMSQEFRKPFERSIIGPQLLKTAEAKAKDIREKNPINLAPFMNENVYGRKGVFEDLADVKRLENEFANQTLQEQEAKRVSDVFEAFFVDAATQMQWFGNESTVNRTARIDDYLRGVDAYTTFNSPKSKYDHLALSTDLTFSLDKSMDKIEGIMSDIAAGRMSWIKYYYNPKTGYAGKLDNLPKTVIGLDGEHLPNFIRLWTHDPSSPELLETRNILINQLHHQLRAFTAFADKRHGNSIIRDSYAQASKQVSSIYNHLQLNSSLIPRDAITDRVINL